MLSMTVLLEPFHLQEGAEKDRFFIWHIITAAVVSQFDLLRVKVMQQTVGELISFRQMVSFRECLQTKYRPMTEERALSFLK